MKVITHDDYNSMIGIVACNIYQILIYRCITMVSYIYTKKMYSSS